jgi:prolyl 4-hydroxylase
LPGRQDPAGLPFRAATGQDAAMSLFAKKKSVGGPSKLRQLIGTTVAARLDATPGAARMPTDAVQFYTVAGFLPDAECDRLVAMIDARRRPSTVLSDKQGSESRTSDSCDMDRFSPEVQPIDEGIAALLGIEPANGETMQGQRYAPGQQFRAHHDYFNEGESYWARMKTTGGQRTWTAMIYLNDVAEGGATWFPRAGVRVSPRKGLLLAWNNMSADGSPNDDTQHEGMAVVEGTKYIVTKWFRESVWVIG